MENSYIETLAIKYFTCKLKLNRQMVYMNICLDLSGGRYLININGSHSSRVLDSVGNFRCAF